MDHANKSCNYGMNMLEGEETFSPPKKLKASRNYRNANEEGGVVHNTCTVTNITGRTVGSFGEASRLAGITK